MKKIIPFLTFILISAACIAPAQTAVLENTALPIATVQFTPIPTLTAEVQAVVQPTVDFPTFTAPTALPGKPNVIQFAANGTYVDLTDFIATGSSKTYSLNAMQGQIMSISTFLQIPDGDWGYMHLLIKGADGSILCPQAPDTDCAFWRGTLPATQDYFVTLTPEGNIPKFIMRVAVNPPGKDIQYFKYNDPATGLALTYPDIFAPAVSVYGNYKTKPELTLQLIDSKTYEKTNLGEAYLFISSNSDSQVVATCTEPNQNGGGFEQIVGNQVINGLTFVHSSSEDAGAGNIYEQEIYRMVNKNICYEVIYFMHSSNIGNFPSGQVTEFDRNAIIQKFYSVFSSFEIE